MATAARDVLIPTSREETVAAFGDGRDVTVIAGGTILMPAIAYGRLRPGRTLMLGSAGLDGQSRENGVVRFGATTTVLALEQAPEPLGTFARGVADYEVRAQGTLGGNLCAPPGTDFPRGDLQVALLALGARVRSAGAAGERVDRVEDFLMSDEPRLVLEVEFDEPVRASAAALRRPHSHTYTVLSVACAEGADGIRVAAGGAGPRAIRCRAVEAALAEGSDASTAAGKILEDADPHDDALASEWYRRKMLPVLAGRALTDLQESR